MIAAAALLFAWKEHQKTKALKLAEVAIEEHWALFNRIIELQEDCSMTEAKWREELILASFADEHRSKLSRKAGLKIEFNSLESMVKMIMTGEGEIQQMQ